LNAVITSGGAAALWPETASDAMSAVIAANSIDARSRLDMMARIIIAAILQR
jgi:hypothetical protein